MSSLLAIPDRESRALWGMSMVMLPAVAKLDRRSSLACYAVSAVTLLHLQRCHGLDVCFRWNGQLVHNVDAQQSKASRLTTWPLSHVLLSIGQDQCSRPRFKCLDSTVLVSTVFRWCRRAAQRDLFNVVTDSWHGVRAHGSQQSAVAGALGKERQLPPHLMVDGRFPSAFSVDLTLLSLSLESCPPCWERSSGNETRLQCPANLDPFGRFASRMAFVDSIRVCYTSMIAEGPLAPLLPATLGAREYASYLPSCILSETQADVSTYSCRPYRLAASTTHPWPLILSMAVAVDRPDRLSPSKWSSQRSIRQACPARPPLP